MSPRKRVFTEAALAVTAFGALGVSAMAAPMPWEASKTPAAITHHAASSATSTNGTVTVLCSGSCYE
ncbi:hypothetical protein [Streptomyces spinosirectus]